MAKLLDITTIILYSINSSMEKRYAVDPLHGRAVGEPGLGVTS